MPDIDALNAVRDFERQILLDADPAALPYYADALEECGAAAAAAVREVAAMSADDLDAAFVKRATAAGTPRPVRLALAAAAAAGRPMGSAELRLSIVDGRWPAKCIIRGEKCFRTAVWPNPEGPGDFIWTFDRPNGYVEWRLDRGWPPEMVWGNEGDIFLSSEGGYVFTSATNVASTSGLVLMLEGRAKAAARRWIEEALDERDG